MLAPIGAIGGGVRFAQRRIRVPKLRGGWLGRPTGFQARPEQDDARKCAKQDHANDDLHGTKRRIVNGEEHVCIRCRKTHERCNCEEEKPPMMTLNRRHDERTTRPAVTERGTELNCGKRRWVHAVWFEPRRDRNDATGAVKDGECDPQTREHFRPRRHSQNLR